jgi:Zn-dependent protease
MWERSHLFPLFYAKKIKECCTEEVQAPFVNIILMAMTFAAFLLAIGFHYSVQALVAAMLGDGSLARERRITLNPSRHAEPIGICVALISAFPAGLTGITPTAIGWGRPLRPDANRFSIGISPGLIVFALSGIVANVGLGLLIALAFGLFVPASGTDASMASACLSNAHTAFGGPLQGCLAAWQPGIALRVEQFVYVFALANITYGLLNIIPLFPLDGYYILFALLPGQMAISYRNRQQMQELILVLVLFVLPFIFALGGVAFSLNAYFFDLAKQMASALSGTIFSVPLLQL